MDPHDDHVVGKGHDTTGTCRGDSAFLVVVCCLYKLGQCNMSWVHEQPKVMYYLVENYVVTPPPPATWSNAKSRGGGGGGHKNGTAETAMKNEVVGHLHISYWFPLLQNVQWVVYNNQKFQLMHTSRGLGPNFKSLS